ncbi:MAG: helix-turn-helix domain-containing protein [Oscillospiraceae bacterium]|nr:helix-turn-helix domain-containing protein [Oscillospiraceae bacterium]
MANFGERLKYLRTAKQFTQKQMAIEFGTTERAYQDYEYDKSHPSYSGLLFMADYFDVSLDWLVGRSEIKERR